MWQAEQNEVAGERDVQDVDTTLKGNQKNQ